MKTKGPITKTQKDVKTINSVTHLIMICEVIHCTVQYEKNVDNSMLSSRQNETKNEIFTATMVRIWYIWNKKRMLQYNIENRLVYFLESKEYLYKFESFHITENILGASVGNRVRNRNHRWFCTETCMSRINDTLDSSFWVKSTTAFRTTLPFHVPPKINKIFFYTGSVYISQYIR